MSIRFSRNSTSLNHGGDLLDKKISLILGSVFILTSGLIYTIERLSRYVYWSAQINTGQYATNPKSIPILDNLFIALFFLIGIIIMIVSFKKESYIHYFNELPTKGLRNTKKTPVEFK